MDLGSSVSVLPFVGDAYAKRLLNLNIKTVGDLLYHFPFRYDDLSRVEKIANAPLGETTTLKGEVVEFKNQYTKQGKKMQIVKIKDETGSIYAIFFNQTYLSNTLTEGASIFLAGKISFWNRKRAIYSPDFEIETNKESIHTSRLVPIYHETEGVSSKWLRRRIDWVLKNMNPMKTEEFLPEDLISDEGFMSFDRSLYQIHFPESFEDQKEARKRLAFNELLLLQIANQKKRREWQKNGVSKKLEVNKKLLKDFVKGLPFKLTKAQKRVTSEISKDLKRRFPMNRLLEGDVGSGKTVVAAIAAYISFLNGFQTVFMAPTQILANQHAHTLKEIFKKYHLRVQLVTSASKKKTKKEGRVDIYVGTHALIHKRADFSKVSLVVIDEQHRFGVEQRAHLIKKSGKKTFAPHVLTMTATPIPRTVALTLYGELDLSILDELPKGRVPSTTWIVPPHKRLAAYGWIKEQIQKDSVQVFVVCPVIEESESKTMKEVRAVKKEYETLKKIFSGYGVSMLHGKLSQKEKERVLSNFRKKKTDILVATPVIEVGVDIPNANIMIVEAAERFGLSQLHQLRGRVGRGGKNSFCLLFTKAKSEKVTKRLLALKKNSSGFALSEIDLSLRGPGEILGLRQSGDAGLKIANWTDIDLIKRARVFAQEVLLHPKKHKKITNFYQSRQTVAN